MPRSKATFTRKQMAAVLGRLRALPPGATVIWTEETSTQARPFVTGWAAIHAPAVWDCGRVWLIVAPKDRAAAHHPGELTLRVAPDLQVASVWDPLAKDDAVVIAVARDRPLDRAQQERLRAAQTRTGCDVVVEDGWSVDLLATVLREWLAERAGRADLRLRFEPEQPISTGMAGLMHRFADTGITSPSQLVRVIRIGKGSVEAGLAAMPTARRKEMVEEFWRDADRRSNSPGPSVQ